MTTAGSFDQLRLACVEHNRAGRHDAALACAEETWRRFPERRDFSWWLVAYADLALGRLSDAIDAMEAAEAEDRLWRISMLRHPVMEPLRAEPRFGALLARVEARIAARGLQPRLLVAAPEPPDPRAPLLLGLHGAASTADEHHGHWLPAVRLGCVVASAQSSQPSTADGFCWDDRDCVRRDLRALLSKLPAHGKVVLTGFSQGAAIALELALAGDVVPASGVVCVGPSYPPSTRFPEAERPLDVVILRGSDDSWGTGVPATVDALRAAGHRVHAETVQGLGHDHPADFAERLPALLAAAGIG